MVNLVADTYVIFRFRITSWVWSQLDSYSILTFPAQPCLRTSSRMAAMSMMPVPFFLLVPHNGGWRAADQLRFEASGKDSGASMALTSSGNGAHHFKMTLIQGGRGYSYSQCASYTIKEGKLLGDETHDEQVVAGPVGVGLLPSVLDLPGELFPRVPKPPNRRDANSLSFTACSLP